MPTFNDTASELATDSNSGQESTSHNRHASGYQADDIVSIQPGWRRMIGMWTRPFTRLHRVPVFKRVWLYLALLAAYTLAIDYLSGTSDPVKLLREANGGSATGTYGSIVLGLLLVFRTNSAYERWWEGRKLWGQLTNESRNLCIKVQALLDLKPAEQQKFGELVIAFAYALKHHLRGTKPSSPLPGVSANSGNEHLPVQITTEIFHQIAGWHRRGLIDGNLFLALDQHVKALMDICGGCERIKTSPIAVSYRAFMRQGIALNLLIWPWYVTSHLPALWSLPPILIGAYFLIGIELIAEDVEDPFGNDGDDLPLDNICTNIKRSISGIMDVRNDRKFTASVEKPRKDLLKDQLD